MQFNLKYDIVIYMVGCDILKNNKLRNLLIIIICLVLVGLIIFTLFSAFKVNKKEEPSKKEEDKKVYEVVEYANITDKHCDAGYCISNYQYLRSENGTYELRFLFENTNSIPLDKGCFKLEYTTDDYYVFCYEKVDAYNVIENGHFIDEDFYSKYDDYKLVTLTGDELNTYYSDYDKYVLNQE